MNDLIPHNEVPQFYPDVMVDIETSGTMPDRHGILQIAAVRFNAATGEVDPNYFDMCLTIPQHRGWSESTRDWWTTQNVMVLAEILFRKKPWRDVMTQFQRWVMQGSNNGEQPALWGKPTHFDFSFLSSYFHDADLAMPFHYRKANDMNSYIRGLWAPFNPPNLERDLEFVGDAHNGVWDSFHQIKVVLEHQRMSSMWHAAINEDPSVRFDDWYEANLPRAQEILEPEVDQPIKPDTITEIVA